jgi:uncharacterized protein YbjT (DUF2867 family)
VRKDLLVVSSGLDAVVREGAQAGDAAAMEPNMIVVTTPTGQIGQHVVRDLLAGDTAIRLIVRDAARLSPDVRERVQVVEGSHGEPQVIDRALDGAEALFWVAPPDTNRPLE